MQQDKIEEARRLVRETEERVEHAKERVRYSVHFDGPDYYREVGEASTELSRATTALALYQAQLSEMEKAGAPIAHDAPLRVS